MFKVKGQGVKFVTCNIAVNTLINILQWNLTKLGKYLVRRRVWNAIDFQGHRVKCLLRNIPEFLKIVGPIGPRGQKIMRSANNAGNAGPHVRQTFLNDVFTFLAEVGNAGSIVNTGVSSVNSEFVTALNM
jgi:hypothetical protein